MEIAYLIFSFLLGASAAGILVYTTFRGSITAVEIAEKYVGRDVLTEMQARYADAETQLAQSRQTVLDLSRDLASLEQINAHLEEKLAGQQTDIDTLNHRFQTAFEQVANRLLEEKAMRFSQQNEKQIGGLLDPLKERIAAFEQSIERKFVEETTQRLSLKTEIEHLRNLNQQLSQDAHNLVKALRGNNKSQGDWGELQLEILLEKAGLLRGVHFQKQNSFADNNGQQKRPDFIVQLPDNKQLVIDAKVSLTAYEQFYNTDDPEQKHRYLKAHLDSLKNHVRGLSEKNYANLYPINTTDYVLMFIPIEPAFAVAVQEDGRIFTEALDKNVLIVTPTSFLATMRTVSFIWKQDNQQKHVLEIARQSGLLYDKFVAFIDDLKEIGQRLNMAQNAYADAMNKLNDSKKYGDTLIGRAEKIKELGAKATKSLPQEMVEK